VAEAQRQLTRIGIDRPAAAATGPPERWADAAPLVGLRLASLRGLAAVATEVLAAHAHPSQALPTSTLWRRLDRLGDTEGLRWLSIPASAGPPAGAGRNALAVEAVHTLGGISGSEG